MVWGAEREFGSLGLNMPGFGTQGQPVKEEPAGGNRDPETRARGLRNRQKSILAHRTRQIWDAGPVGPGSGAV